MPDYKRIDKVQTTRIAKNMKDLAGMYSRRVGGSGSKWQAKGDVYTSMFLIEAKDKASKSKQRTIYRETFDKIWREAIEVGKMPLYVVGFGDGDDFMILRDKDFYEIIERLVAAESKLREQNIH